MTANGSANGHGNGHKKPGRKPKLSDERADQLLTDWALRRMSYSALARKYGVCMTTVKNAINRVSAS